MRPTESRSALFGIVAGIFVSGTGIGSLLPILPLYLRERGASYALVGVIVGSALLAQAIGQWPAGILAERVGAKAMMIGGLVVAAAASVTFIIPLPIEWLIVLRFVQGLGFAAIIPAELAAVADVVPRAKLGRAYGWVSGAQQAGYIGGPAIGGFLAVFGRWTVFAVTGAALLAAAAVIAVTLRTSSRVRVDNVPRPAVSGPSRAKAAVIAVAILSIGLGLLIGVYDVIWSLYMRSRGASDPVVGLSFTLFALPLLVATPLAGWSSDRWDRRWLAVGSVVLLTSIPTILFVGLFEGALWAFTTPSMNSFLMDAVADRRAEAQGIVGTALSSATAVGSLVGGALFALGVAIPFLVAAGAGIVFALAALPWMLSAGARRPVPEGESA